jgi:hypothetical protein
MVSKIPNVWATKATRMMLAGPKEWYTNPPMIIEMGNPKNHMELIKPSCSPLSPNCSPSCGNIPALMAKVKAVVIRAKQLPLNKALLLMFSFIDVGFKML